MSVKEIKLISPNNGDITGLLLEDGTVCPVVFMYDSKLLVRDVILQEMHSSPPKKVNGQSIYVDKNGGEWSSLDVEYHSVLNS